MDKKLLVISRSVPPGSSGTSVIIENVARFFDKNKIVVIGQKTLEKYSERMEGLPPIHYMDTHVDVLGRGHRYLKWVRFPSVLKNAIEIAKREKVTHILSIFPDEFYLYLGYRVSKKLGIPFYTWFHNTYLDNADGLRRPIARMIQPKIFEHAQMNFVMSDGILNEFKNLYPGTKFKTLVHGFKIPKIELTQSSNSSQVTKYVFTGSLNVSNEDACLRLFDCILNSSQDEIHIYSGNAKIFLESRRIISERIIYHGFVTLKQLQVELLNYDIMLLPHGFGGKAYDIEFKTIFPTRTIPLLYSSRPILAHSPSDVFLTEFLKVNKCAFVIDSKEPSFISSEINRFKNDVTLKKEVTVNALQTAEMFNVNNVLQTLKSEISFEN